ncbi:hypothetical protein BDQ17DRAFT_1172322, partial [Cyathus striatus]
KEVGQAIKDLKPGKAPGLDGIPNEFWKQLVIAGNEEESKGEHTFDITKMLALVFNEIHQKGLVLNSTLHEGWMCPLFKKKDCTCIENYRPITVLNTDYKMLTCILKNRIAPVLPYLIHTDQ